ncbi:nickel pincer cofactor biosynthesis protein LarC [Thermosulfurimonas sp. F29]|uniref:nickel pincer cofactor biosynthesis protein LarC n=1 Tax=Thermosulfurimonas sp. F29 TaxID=2867247 RepID=UPI001C83B62A|nr:nickel pincer cofactor biosynthesis protein LarC [Thermosulfurimonas sp. F29]MBX6423787.1 nickel pincer cofactor biosynthesis protein LarC [Thermosulfurimonas sp. F29]
MTERENKRAYLQAVGGVAGDMFLAALIAAGVPEEDLSTFLSTLPGGLILKTERVSVAGISALRVRLSAAEPGGLPSRFAEFMALLDRLDLSEGLREKARGVFRRIFEAEARVHGVSLEAVNLHELSAWDTLGDVLGVLWGLERLGITELYVSPLPLGQGLIHTAHGVLPLPAPATLEILRGVPVYGVEERLETVTPTGAALVRVLARGFGPLPEMSLETVGLGAGHHELSTRPNLLRLLVGTSSRIGKEEVCEIVTDLDDETPETLAHVAERLLSAGALDVGFSPRFMKKGRPGVRLEVLCRPEEVSRLSDLVLEETSTLGVRIRRVKRRVLPREVREMETPYGTVRLKLARTPSGRLKAKPEHEDLAGVALKERKPLHRIKKDLERWTERYLEKIGYNEK